MNEYTEYEKQEWKNYPDETTPLSAERLEHIESGIYEASHEICSMKENMVFLGTCTDEELQQAIADSN